jgi:hypothetical protein
MLKTVLILLLAGVTLWPQSDVKTLQIQKPVNPPGWAALERRLIEEMSKAAFEFTRRFTRTGGTLIWKTKGSASFDDPYESFYNFPLLYALGGHEGLLKLSFDEWNAMTRQLDNDFHAMHKEYAKYGDWFHHGEGNLFFYYLGLADPTDYELAARARRFAGFYLNEDPEAQNYDPKLKIIRSPVNGSLGPQFGSADKARPFVMAKGMAVYGLPLEDVPGIRTAEDLQNPENARRFGVALQERLYRGGDVPPNLAATTLAANAYLFTGEQKYADWVKEYVGAWVERTRANGGITPDNVGLSGKVGEYFNGKWWGGLYGWRWPHGYHSVGQAIHIGAANAMLLSGGDAGYLEMPRTTMDKLIAAGKMEKGRFVTPTQKDSNGWFAFAPADRSYLASLWFMSQDPADWQRIEKIRQADHDDWNHVRDMHNKMDAGHDAPWLRFLAGANPGYPERILASAHGQVLDRLQKMRDNVLLIDEYPGTWRKVDAGKVDYTKLNEHHWQGQNPVTTEALVQLMLGAPQIQYNGGLLFASVRYFDPERRRPGMPEDVAGLVRKIEAGRIELELVNLSPFHSREVIVQAGTFGEHNFTTVKASGGEAVEVNRKFLSVRLAPGAGATLDMGLKRYANKPSYAFPWHGDTVPVK